MDLQVNSLHSSLHQLELHTDASLTGWGATFGGHWVQEDLNHINCLELKAILLGLQSVCGNCRNKHKHLHSNNTTAVACTDRCGSTIIYHQ